MKRDVRRTESPESHSDLLTFEPIINGSRIRLEEVEEAEEAPRGEFGPGGDTTGGDVLENEFEFLPIEFMPQSGDEAFGEADLAHMEKIFSVGAAWDALQTALETDFSIITNEEVMDTYLVGILNMTPAKNRARRGFMELLDVQKEASSLAGKWDNAYQQRVLERIKNYAHAHDITC